MKKEKGKVVRILKGIIFVVAFIAVSIICGETVSKYSREATVASIKGDVIVFEDWRGHCWKWEKEEKEKEYYKNEKIVLVFYDNHTREKIEDDIILRVERK